MKRDPHCSRCKLGETAQYVCLLGQGPEPCEAMVIGEAPGKREDDSGKAFVGSSGQFLEEILESVGLPRKKLFITNAVNCRPPGNRTPTKGEIKACKHWVDYQIKMVKPKYILLLGNVPLISITGKGGIRKARGKPFELNGIVYLPTYHPSYIANYAPEHQPIFEKDLKLFADIIEERGIPKERELNLKIVRTYEDFEELLGALKGTVSFDIETNGLYPWSTPIYKKNKKTKITTIEGHTRPQINTIGFGTETGEYIIPAAIDDTWKDYQIRGMLKLIQLCLENCFVVTQGGKFDFLWMRVIYGVKWTEFNDFDTMLASYILDENTPNDLKTNAQLWCGAPDWDLDPEAKKGHKGLDILALYQAHDLFYTRKLKYVFAKQLFEEGGLKRVFREILMPCARMFCDIEYNGVFIDIKKMDAAEKFLLKEVADAEKEMRKWADINWASPKQLGHLLFTKLKLPVVERTKKGAVSTSESVIKRIKHPIADAILKFRSAKQNLSFFIEGWKPYLVKTSEGYYIHPSFKLHGTVTGRPSCEHPNLQQTPREELIRSLISAPEGWQLLDADFSQIELRLAAESAGETNMLAAFKRGDDAHWLKCLQELERGAGERDLVIKTAKAIAKKQVHYADSFDILRKAGATACSKIDGRWKELRKKAKAVNFGYLYGMWWKKFIIYARDNYGVKVTDEEAEQSREDFFDMWPDFVDWHKAQKRYARMNGYVKSFSGRKRHLPAAQEQQKSFERDEAERQAINSPIQSFASDLNLMAALQLYDEYGNDIVQLCGTVHDSILVRVKNAHVVEVCHRLLQIMSHPKLMDVFDIRLGVPIEAEVKVGPWSLGIPVEEWKCSARASRK